MQRNGKGLRTHLSPRRDSQGAIVSRMLHSETSAGGWGWPATAEGKGPRVSQLLPHVVSSLSARNSDGFKLYFLSSR